MISLTLRHPAHAALALVAVLLVGVWAGLAFDHSHAIAQAPNGMAPPFDLGDPSVIKEGSELFRQTCTGYCHGKDGGPSRAPTLRGAKLEQSYVRGRIMKGSPNGMPAFETILTPDKIWKLVAYVQSLSNPTDK
jgi:mono/diheme cytochrome c family protein